MSRTKPATTPREPWHRPEDRWTWVGFNGRWSSPTRPKWKRSRPGWYEYDVEECHYETGGSSQVAAVHRASLRRIETAAQATRREPKVVPREAWHRPRDQWMFVSANGYRWACPDSPVWDSSGAGFTAWNKVDDPRQGSKPHPISAAEQRASLRRIAPAKATVARSISAADLAAAVAAVKDQYADALVELAPHDTSAALSVVRWHLTTVRRPRCPRGEHALGREVLVHPRARGATATAFYGRRATGKPCFYLHGAAVEPQPTHWAEIPECVAVFQVPR